MRRRTEICLDNWLAFNAAEHSANAVLTAHHRLFGSQAAVGADLCLIFGDEILRTFVLDTTRALAGRWRVL